MNTCNNCRCIKSTHDKASDSKRQSDQPLDSIQIWDHGLMINDALWDSWFASSLAARPSSLGGTGREELKTVLQQAFSTDASSNRASGIANRRFMPDLQGKPSEAVVEELARTDEGYKHASKYLTVAGGFNVNSTSQRAWEATLLGLKKRKILYSRSGRPSVLNNSQTSFSRFGVAEATRYFQQGIHCFQ